jgi:TRAP-type C4-dicarboxylate transport system substrate-binding protein
MARCCGHDEHDHAAIVRNLVWDKLTPADRVVIMNTAEAVAEARLELEESL